MRHPLAAHTVRQSGFTLIELVIVIVIIGILAAVAVPKLTGVSAEATKASNTAILGAVRSAWSSAYAIAKTSPTTTQVAAQMTDPTCSASSTVITCGSLSITAAADPVAKPTDLTCTTASDCL